MDLSILIPTHTRDSHLLPSLIEVLNAQAEHSGLKIEILIDLDNGERTTGAKSNDLMAKAQGEYLCRFDSDDYPTLYYMSTLAAAIHQGVDCASLRGIMTTNSTTPELFEHSIRHDRYWTKEDAKHDEVKYFRFPNHLNCVKASIAKQFKYPDLTISEDTDFATQMFKSGLLKNEFYTDTVIYCYRYRPRK